MYIIRKQQIETGKRAGYVKQASDYRKVVVLPTYRIAQIIADKMSAMKDGFDYIVELHEENDCSDSYIIHA